METSSTAFFKNKTFSIIGVINIAWKVSVFWVFLVRIFPHSDWIRRDTEYLSVFLSLFSANAAKYGPENAVKTETIFQLKHLAWFSKNYNYYTPTPSSSPKFKVSIKYNNSKINKNLVSRPFGVKKVTRLFLTTKTVSDLQTSW